MVQRAKEDLRDLSGPQKAAAFMLAIGEAQAGPLLKKLDQEELRMLLAYMVQLGKVSANVVEKLLRNFIEQISQTSLIGSYEATERLLAASLDPDRVKEIMEEIRGPSGRTMWDKLGHVNESILANYLKNEYPQTVAVVLSKIKPAHAARVLALWPENFAMEVVMRMLRLQTVQKEVLAHLERSLRSEFMTTLAHPDRTNATGLVAEIFNSLDRNTESRFMGALEERNPEYAEEIKRLMFTFEDLLRVGAAGIQVLMRGIPKEQLTVALKGASEPLKELFFANMSERAAKMLREDMVALGPVRLRDVDEAQGAIIAIAKTLAEAGEISIGGQGGDSDELVE